MLRANCHFLPGYVWHITHRCHHKQFQLKFARDRRRYLQWVFEANKRFGLSVLNYVVTCNHIHLLVRDRGEGEIARAMQLVSGRTAQSFNNRKRRDGAFWQDRYHATAVEHDVHLLRCMAYIDLNMVRANVVAHPADWDESGYREIQRLPQRYRIIDVATLQHLFGCATPEAVRALVIARTARALAEEKIRRDPAWTESLAVGSRQFLVQVKQSLGLRAAACTVVEGDDLTVLREDRVPYRPI